MYKGARESVFKISFERSDAQAILSIGVNVQCSGVQANCVILCIDNDLMKHCPWAKRIRFSLLRASEPRLGSPRPVSSYWFSFYSFISASLTRSDLSRLQESSKNSHRPRTVGHIVQLYYLIVSAEQEYTQLCTGTNILNTVFEGLSAHKEVRWIYQTSDHQSFRRAFHEELAAQESRRSLHWTGKWIQREFECGHHPVSVELRINLENLVSEELSECNRISGLTTCVRMPLNAGRRSEVDRVRRGAKIALKNVHSLIASLNSMECLLIRKNLSFHRICRCASIKWNERIVARRLHASDCSINSWQANTIPQAEYKMLKCSRG